MDDGCTTSGPNGDPPPTPPDPPVTTYYLNSPQTVNGACAERYGGGTYTYVVPAGSQLASSQATANANALAAGEAFVVAHKFCLNAPCLCPCKDVSTTLNIKTVGGTGPFTFSITSGTLPTGLSMAVVGGVLRVTGTPTVAGSSAITIEVYDSVGGYLTKNLTFYVIAITTTSLPNFTAGVPYSQQISATGGTGDYDFSIPSGSLPAGLSLSSTGLISGTPTVSASETFTVAVIDTTLGQTVGCTKELTLESSFTGIYYAFGTTGGAIAVDSFGENDTDLNQGARTLVSGPVVSAWLFDSVVPPVQVWFNSSTLSDKTLITSKSVTIRFWVKCLEPVTLFQAFHKFVIATRYFSIGIKDGALDGAWNKSPDSGSGFGFICYANLDAVDDGNWHRIIFVYDEDTGEARFQVDNNTPTLETVDESLIVENGSISGTAPAVPDVVAVQLCPYFEIISGGYPPPYNDPGYYSGVYLAEVYVAPGVIWDNADCTYDWNGGNGRTYPDLP